MSILSYGVTLPILAHLDFNPLTWPDGKTISVVIVTYQRPDACERALRSVLAQSESPLEVLVCDDCSADQTEARLRAWERRDERVRYLRTPLNSGAPAATRNLGVKHARGDWIAFLDDDDEWLPGKLTTQLAAVATEPADVIAANALRSDGSVYLQGAPSVSRPTRWDLLKANPIIMCSVLVRRKLLLAVGGFPTADWTRGIDDYAAWLELADRGARFVVLGDALVRYEDSAKNRLSRHRAQSQLGVTRLTWSHALRSPTSLAGIRAALRASLGVGHVLASEGWRGLRLRSPDGART
jgi:teichuronic acid biosynthesis glycosyltransferase TuaG